jgi:hypothetical protein
LVESLGRLPHPRLGCLEPKAGPPLASAFIVTRVRLVGFGVTGWLTCWLTAVIRALLFLLACLGTRWFVRSFDLRRPLARSPARRLLGVFLPLDAPLRDARDAFERAYFEYHLLREQGSMTRVAERTGLERTHLYRKLKQLGVDLSRGVWRKREP